MYASRCLLWTPYWQSVAVSDRQSIVLLERKSTRRTNNGEFSVPAIQRTGERLTWAEAAVALAMSVRTLQRLKAQGAIGSIKLAGKVYFTWDDIDAYVKSQHVAATAKPKSATRKTA